VPPALSRQTLTIEKRKIKGIKAIFPLTKLIRIK